MVRRTESDEDSDERMAEAQAQIEALQAAAAEARAATARTELAAAKQARTSAEAQLAEVASGREAAEVELSRLRSDVEEVRTQLSEAAVKYREAKLSAAPEVPADLVPASESLAEIDQGFEAAQRIVGQLRSGWRRSGSPRGCRWSPRHVGVRQTSRVCRRRRRSGRG